MRIDFYATHSGTPTPIVFNYGDGKPETVPNVGCSGGGCANGLRTHVFVGPGRYFVRTSKVDGSLVSNILTARADAPTFPIFPPGYVFPPRFVRGPNLAVTDVIVSVDNPSVSRDCFNSAVWNGKPPVQTVTEGTVTCYLARVKNVGTAISPKTSLSLLIDGGRNGNAGGTVPALRPGEERVIGTAGYKHTKGTYAITMKADQADPRLDTSRLNNSYSTTLIVEPKAPVGTLTVSRNTTNPDLSNPLGFPGQKNVPVGAFDFTVTGEPIQLTQFKLRLTPTTASASELSTVSVYATDGRLVAGPKNGSTVTASTFEDVTFNDTIALPVGVTTLLVKMDLSVNMSSGDTVAVAMVNPSAQMIVTGGRPNQTILVLPVASVASNTLTVQGPKLSVVTSGVPQAGSVVAGVQAYTFAVIDLDPSGTVGEDVRVNSIVIRDVYGPGAQSQDIVNLKLAGDPDNTDNNNTLVVLETTESTAVGAASVRFTFRTPLRVSRYKVSRLYLKADVLRSASIGPSSSHTFRVGESSEISAQGITSGVAIFPTTRGSGQTQTIASSGSLKVQISPLSSTSQGQMVAGSTGNVFMQYKFTSSLEQISVSKLPIALAFATSAVGVPIVPTAISPDIARVTLWASDTETGSQTQIGRSTGYTIDASGKISDQLATDLTANPFKVPKDPTDCDWFCTFTNHRVGGGTRFLTIKADLNDKTMLRSGDVLILGIGDATGDASDWGTNGAASANGKNYGITASGQDSGTIIAAATINSVGAGSAGTIQASYNMPVYDGILTITKRPSPAFLAPGSAADLLYFDLTATGDTINVSDLEFTYSTTCTVTGTSPATLKSFDDQGNQRTLATWGGSSITWFGLSSGRRSFKIVGAENATSGRGAGGFDAGQTLTIGNGQTVHLKLTGDITGCTTNQTLQVRIDAGATNSGADQGRLTSGMKWNDGDLGPEKGVDSTITKNLPVNGNALIF